jgi:hypothetical protein
MDVSRMAISITKIINEQYMEYIENECIDVIQINNICNLYKTKSSDLDSINLDEIQFSTPDFKSGNKIDKSTRKKHQNILNSAEFKKKYAFFVRIIYACLKMDIAIFDIVNGVATLKNNYQLIKSLEIRKKGFLNEHLLIIKYQLKNVSKTINEDYETYLKDYVTKIKIIDKITGSINKLIDTEVFSKTDNLFTLILPYFYVYTEYIEEYN